SQNLRNKISVLERQLQLSEKVVSELRIELSRQERILNVMQSDEIRIVELKGQSTSPQASGKVYWSPDQHRAVFLAFNLPLPPLDKEYQLWMIRSGTQPVDAGIFSLTAQGSAVSVIDTIEDSLNLTAFAVTLEPQGGVPQPTGDMYLLGTVPSG
ncbi:MAG: anti-sigma factor, partial [bacterium]